MTAAAVAALRADHGALVEIAGSFSADEWATPSACDGWAVRDVVAHMAQLFRQVVDPGALPPPDPSGSTERTQDLWVEAMRPLPVEEVLADYRGLGERAIVAVAGLQGNESPIDLGDLGTHPLYLIANAYAFDHHTHIRVDLLGPLGPLRHPAPPPGEEQLDAATDWILAGMPQMNASELAWLDAPLVLNLCGPAGRVVHVAPVGEGRVEVRDGTSDAAAATVTSSTGDLVLWATRRRSWRDLDVILEGDAEVAARFCESVHVI